MNLSFDNPQVGKDGRPYEKMLRTGCGVRCQATLGPQTIDCPSCLKFTWHFDCLKKAFEITGKNMPDISTKSWKCPQCAEFWVYMCDSWAYITCTFEIIRISGSILIYVQFFGMSSYNININKTFQNKVTQYSNCKGKKIMVQTRYSQNVFEISYYQTIYARSSSGWVLKYNIFRGQQIWISGFQMSCLTYFYKPLFL